MTKSIDERRPTQDAMPRRRRLRALVAASALVGALVGTVAVPNTASAAAVTWRLDGAVLGAGRTASGSFTYDADTNTYSDVNVTVTGFGGDTLFTESIRLDITNSTTLVLGQRPDGDDQTGARISRIRFDNPLTNAGGASPINVVSPNSFVGICNDAPCSIGIGVFGFYTGGQVITGQRWFLQGARIGAPNRAATGSFVYDAATNTYSDVNVTVTGFGGDTLFTESIRLDITNSTTVLLGQRPDGDDQTGARISRIRFDNPLTNAGGSSPINTVSINSFVGVCNDAPCAVGIGVFAAYSEGQVTTTPLEAPTITNAGLFTVAENTTDVADIDATDDFDSEGSGLTYSVGGSDAALFAIDATGALAFVDPPDFEAPFDGGDNDYEVTLTVTDRDGLSSSADVTIRVTDVNETPTVSDVSDQTVAEGATVSIPITATDPDGDNLTLTTSGLPSFCTLTDNTDGTGTIDCAPGFDDTGTTQVEVTATDDGTPPLQTSDTFDLTVTDVNRPPTIDDITDQTVAEGATVSIPVAASDPDGDNLTLSTDGLPSFCTLTDNTDGTGTIDCAPGFDDTGTTQVEVTATDDGTPPLQTSDTFDLTVTDVNRPPIIDDITEQTVDEGATVSIPITATDPDGDNLTLDVSAPPFCTFNVTGAASGELSCAPGFDDAGIYPVEVSSQDDGTPALTSALSFQLIVSDVNRPPVVVAIADQTVAEGATLSIPVEASDPDGDNLTLSTDGLPSFCTLTDNTDGTGTIDCTPGFLDSGTYAVSLLGSDDGSPNLTASASFELNVVEVNDPPVVDAGPDAEITVPAAASLTGSATDDGQPIPPGGVTVEWTVVSGAGDVFIQDPSSLTTTAIFEGGGEFVLRLTASDGQLTSSDDVTITVNNPLGCTVFGTDGPDQLVGTGNAEVICGFGGNDHIYGLGGADMIFGGSGNDLMYGGDGDDTMSSPSGSNAFYGEDGNDTIDGGVDRDVAVGGDDNDTIAGSDGDDILRGGSGNDIIDGGAGDDTIKGGTGNDELSGGDDDDTMSSKSGTNTFRGDAGNDDIRGGSGEDDIDGGTGDDLMYGAGGNDTMSSPSGSNTFYGQNGNDTINGGIDRDVAVGAAGEDIINGSDGDDLLRGGPDNDIIDAGDGQDVAEGGIGNDTIAGSDGDDILRGGSGNDITDGGAGNDVTRGGTGDDQLDDGIGDDSLFGEAGNDVLRDLIGTNFLKGGAGDDLCTTSAGTVDC